MIARDERTIRETPWSEHVEWLDEHWEPGQHVSIFAPTGTGKSYLIRNGLMPLWTRSRAVIIDTKHDRGTLAGMGNCVSRWPTHVDRFKYHMRSPRSSRWEEDPEWFCIQPPHVRWHDDSKAREADQIRVQSIIGRALDNAWQDGDWVVVLDEVNDVSGKVAPDLDLLPQLKKIWREGRDRNITIIAGTQQPAWAPPHMYDQPTYVYIAASDEARRDRLAEIGGDSKRIQDVLATLGENEFLFVERGPRDSREMGVVRVGDDRNRV